MVATAKIPWRSETNADFARWIAPDWIESSIRDRPASEIKDFPLPTGEGQGEGKVRSMTQRRYVITDN